MKIGITGHSRGLGAFLFDHFSKNHHVLGFSRQNGFELPNKFQEVCDIANTCDLFINNAYIDDIQTKFLEHLSGKIQIISCGSMAADYVTVNNNYGSNKLKLEKKHKEIKKITTVPMLLLKMGYLENYPDRYPISYKEVVSGIDCWLSNKRISIIEFENNPKIYNSINKI